MRTLQLACGVLIAVAAAGACNRADTDTRKEVAAGVKATAAKAGDQLADTWITTKIQAQYFADDDIKARHINVSTRDGVVTLSGRVENSDAREQAIQIARLTDGVRQVDDRLHVGAPATAGSGPAEKLESAWITTKIQARFFATPAISSRDIDVTTTNGVVTLRGTVENEEEKQAAMFIARNTDGVTAVEDRLSVRTSGAVATTGTTTGSTAGAAPEPAERIDDARITAAVQSKYYLDDQLKGRRIEVDSRQGVVTLRGEVGSETERAQALLLARNTDGVVRVEDSLTVNASLTAPVGTTGQPAQDRMAGERSDDSTLTATIQSKFFVDDQVKAGAIEVTARDGVVLLQGTVPSEAARARALAIARGTDGVAQVVDRLTIELRGRP